MLGGRERHSHEAGVRDDGTTISEFDSRRRRCVPGTHAHRAHYRVRRSAGRPRRTRRCDAHAQPGPKGPTPAAAAPEVKAGQFRRHVRRQRARFASFPGIALARERPARAAIRRLDVVVRCGCSGTSDRSSATTHRRRRSGRPSVPDQLSASERDAEHPQAVRQCGQRLSSAGSRDRARASVRRDRARSGGAVLPVAESWKPFAIDAIDV